MNIKKGDKVLLYAESTLRKKYGVVNGSLEVARLPLYETMREMLGKVWEVIEYDRRIKVSNGDSAWWFPIECVKKVIKHE